MLVTDTVLLETEERLTRTVFYLRLEPMERPKAGKEGGWLRVTAGCTKCHYATSFEQGLGENGVKAGVLDTSRIEEQVLQMMVTAAATLDCPHLERFLEIYARRSPERKAISENVLAALKTQRERFAQWTKDAKDVKPRKRKRKRERRHRESRSASGKAVGARGGRRGKPDAGGAGKSRLAHRTAAPVARSDKPD